MLVVDFAYTVVIYAVNFVLVAYLGKIVVGLTKRIYHKNIPYVSNNSVFGYTRLMFHDQDAHRIYLSLIEKLGPVFQFNFFGSNRVVIADSKLAKIAMKKISQKGVGLTSDGINQRGVKGVFPAHLFTLQTGADWQLRRSLFKHSFSSISLRNFNDVMRSLIDKMCRVLTDRIRTTSNPVLLDVVCGQMTMDVICNIAFGFDIKALDNSSLYLGMEKALRETFELVWIGAIPYATVLMDLPFLSRFSPFARFKKARETINEFNSLILAHLKESEANGTLRDDSFGKTLMQFSRLPNITEDHVKGEIEVMFIAGHETTAHTMSWILYSIAKDSKIQKQAQAAVDCWNWSSGDAGSNQQAIPPFIEAVVKETLRKFPPAIHMMRKIDDPAGFQLDLNLLQERYRPSTNPQANIVVLPRGSLVVVAAHAIHNSKDIWGANAEKFVPERWLRKTEASEKSKKGAHVGRDKELERDSELDVVNESGNRDRTSLLNAATSIESKELLDCDHTFDSAMENPLASPAVFAGGGFSSENLDFVPFSYGLRNCIGMNMALMELRMAICSLVRNFNFELADKEFLDEKVAVQLAFTLRPKDQLPMIVTLREKNIE